MSDTDFNLAAFEAADTSVLDVLDARDEPLMYNGKPVQIVLAGPGSEAYVKAQAKIDRANQERVFQAVRGKAPKDGADEQRKQLIEKLVACTVEVRNFPVSGGAAAIYANPKLGYITNQVAKFLEDWQHFLPKSQAT
jgi:hypothetical protein